MTNKLTRRTENLFFEYDVEDSIVPLQPSINYTAPELVRSKTFSVGSAADIFSFGCLAYHLIARKPLFDCNNNVKMYMNSLNYLTRDSFSKIPRELVPDLQRMLSANEASRPTALDFTGSSFFREDTRLRALRFLDHLLERDNMQKTEFLKALSDMWKDFDPRVLRYKVLPPLCAELRNLVMQPMILPMVLTIAESQDKNDFEQSTLPALVPVLSGASGDTLLLLVKNVELIINKASQEHLITHILPMLVRAYDDTDARLQEEVLKKTIPLAKQLDTQLVKQAVLPRVHALALRTTVAAVRVNALLCFTDMIQILDNTGVLEILQTVQRCTDVDHSAPTLMCTLGIANSILKQHGVEFVAVHVLPLLTPLLITQQLNVQQFAKHMFFVKDVLRKIEEKRGVTLTDFGLQEQRPPPAAEGFLSGQMKKPVSTAASNTKRSSAWDEDWIPSRAAATAPPTSTATSTAQPAVPSQPALSKLSPASSAPNAQQQPPLCPAVDVEWPPKNSSIGTVQFGSSDILNETKSTSGSNLDDIDPFANWPPRPSGTTNASSSMKNGFNSSSTPSNGLGNQSASWSFGIQSQSHGINSSSSVGSSNPRQYSLGQLKQNHGASAAIGSSSEKATDLDSIFASNKNENNAPRRLAPPLGQLKQNHGASAAIGSSNEKATDLDSIFASNKKENNAPRRLAPPPTTAVGRGRGRGRGSQGQTKTQTQQPPLLNLL